MILINRSKAENITWSRLRIERDTRLAALDLVYLRAIEVGDDTASIVNERQALRRLPDKTLDGLSIEQLAALTVDDALEL